MSRIKILPEILSNKIAAGEVVERPASVVKELVENALDAQSSRILIEIEKGGRSLIRVSDNGIGMGHDDALLSMERYATSKIYNDSDLFSIRTLGFRGEALPSIASVSKFTLESREPESDAGVRIEADGGRIKNVTEAGIPPGTLVSVQNLFFNTPARRKFLKTINTEMGHIGDTVASMALGWPSVAFRLHHNGREIKHWPPASEPLKRAVDVLGLSMHAVLHPVEASDEGGSLSGWVAPPHVTRATSRSTYVFVNGRYIRDRMIQHALGQGYAGRLMKGQFPVAVLFLTVRPEEVDVNVHPAKNEVRFARHKEIHQLIADAVRETLLRADAPKWSGQTPEISPAPELFPDASGDDFGDAPTPPPPRPSVDDAPPSPDLISERMEDFQPSPMPPPSPAEAGAQSVPSFSPPAAKEADRGPLPSDQSDLWEKKQFSSLRVIGQLHSTYILCESKNGLILIDQHAAHERIFFEELKRRAESEKQAASQILLMPETIDLNYREADILQQLIPIFGQSGFTIEPFGGNTLVIKSVPVFLSGGEAGPVVREILEKIADIGVNAGIERVRDECLELIACHGAIRANQALSPRHIQGLLEQLDQCENPSHCPHGRPTWILWDRRFLEKSFRRIV